MHIPFFGFLGAAGSFFLLEVFPFFLLLLADPFSEPEDSVADAAKDLLTLVGTIGLNCRSIRPVIDGGGRFSANGS